MTGAGLGAWALLFWYLLISGDWSLYLAARVDWLVPVAAVAFSIGAIGRLVTARVLEPEPLRKSDARGLAITLAPVLLIALVPLGTLTSFAADRRTSFSLAQFSSANPIEAGQPLTFQQLVGAAESDEGLAQLAQREGERVELVGLLMEPTPDGFTLTRFVVACCVVDATVAEVRVRGPVPDLPEGSWVAVSGQLTVEAAHGPVLERPQIEPTTEPDPPYLYPGGG